MRKITHAVTGASAGASPQWETLERFARQEIQEFIQRLLEEEVEELLGRKKSERRGPDTAVGYRNGQGKPRQLALTNGTITLRRPRVRDLEERFVSRVLPLFKRRTAELGALLPELYLHGLALGDFELALRGLLGDGAPLSASSIQRLKGEWQAQYAAWVHARCARSSSSTSGRMAYTSKRGSRIRRPRCWSSWAPWPMAGRSSSP